MASCEKCWWDAWRLYRDGLFNTQYEAYKHLLKERENNPCTAKEQAGQFWDEEKQIDIRLERRDK